jgi:hypothetical protein
MATRCEARRLDRVGRDFTPIPDLRETQSPNRHGSAASRRHEVTGRLSLFGKRNLNGVPHGKRCPPGAFLQDWMSGAAGWD